MLDLVKKNKDQEAEKFASEMLNPIGLINEYKQKYEPIINESSKAIVILGQDKADLNIIADLLKDKKLEIKSNKYGNLAFSETNDHNDKVDILNIPARENQSDFIIYNSTYLNNNHSFSQSILNTFFLQKILYTMPTKFILVIKDIAIKNDQSPNTQNKITELTNILWEFTNLFETIDIGINNNISVVFTDTINNKTKAQISNIFNESLEERSFSEKQKSIIAKLACSTSFFPKPSNPPKYGGILKILYNKDYIIPNENNKITINYSTSEDILSTTNIINIEVKSNIHALKTEINRVWNEEKNTIFDLSKNQKLEQLIKILKDSQARDNKDKTIENFLKVSDELYSILQISKPENDLNTLINYLKYFSNIKNFQENSDLINPSELFDNLFSEVADYNINEELLVAFIATIDSTKDSFLKKLNEAVQNFYNNVKNNKILDTAEVNNVLKLREFLTKIKTVNIKNLEDIKTNLKSNLINLSLTLSIDKNITNLQNLINPINEEEAKSIWEYIVGSITVISKDEDINIVIYNKLLYSEIPSRQEIYTYNKLEELLKAMSQEHKKEQLYKKQLAEIYCQKAEISTTDKAKVLYKEAIELGSVKANIKLGGIELDNKNYSEAIKYLYNTSDITNLSKAFKNLVNDQKLEIINKIQQGNTEDVIKLSSVLTELCLKQAKYCKDYGLIILATKAQELTKIAFFDVITVIESIGGHSNYKTLSNIYKCLGDLSSTLHNQLEFNKKARWYENYEQRVSNNIEEDSEDQQYAPPLLDFNYVNNSWGIGQKGYFSGEDINFLGDYNSDITKSI